MVAGRVGRPTGALLAMLGREGPFPNDEEHGMPADAVERFLAALDPEHRESVSARPREEQEGLAAAWERELESDTELDILDELSPSAAEAEAARRVLDRGTG
ncbi:hypothetical protein GCM10019016_135750 [Streptomyces prasinosporus]|uniref:Uncharacterized protein n=2 Tax=Streptomyces prasinosporus TaxID=68256 RepID=A0ABP6UGV9_9ACTN